MARKPKIVQIVARVPQDVKDWLKRQAERNGASQNSEIIRSVRDRMDSERRARAVEPT